MDSLEEIEKELLRLDLERRREIAAETKRINEAYSALRGDLGKRRGQLLRLQRKADYEKFIQEGISDIVQRWHERVEKTGRPVEVSLWTDDIRADKPIVSRGCAGNYPRIGKGELYFVLICDSHGAHLSIEIRNCPSVSAGKVESYIDNVWRVWWPQKSDWQKLSTELKELEKQAQRGTFHPRL